MPPNRLRAVQQPLKDRYRDEPAAARITLSAEGSLGEGVSCSVATGAAVARAGLHPATGGDGTLVCSGDMLLQALVACAGVTLGAVAASLDIPVAGGTVRAEGDLDFRGTLAVTREAPVGFSAIRVAFDLDSEATDEQLDTLARLTERYCVVYQTLARPPRLRLSRRREGAEGPVQPDPDAIGLAQEVRTMPTAHEAFSEAADRLSALALKLKLHYQEERGDETGTAVRDALSKLGAAVEDVFEAVGDAARDDAVRSDARQAARSVGDALATVFAQVGDELRSCFNRRDDAAKAGE